VGTYYQQRFSFKKGKFRLVLDKEITGISDGQAVVLYKKKKYLEEVQSELSF
jgi:tRNA U34 2-thiouridine synthase MnmA/TrmU